jgi:hypothetical protein
VLKRPETLERDGGTPADMDIILDQLAATMQQPTPRDPVGVGQEAWQKSFATQRQAMYRAWYSH